MLVIVINVSYSAFYIACTKERLVVLESNTRYMIHHNTLTHTTLLNTKYVIHL